MVNSNVRQDIPSPLDSVRRDQIRIGILIVGSLLWSNTNNRDRWRMNRLDMRVRQTVRVPVRYGRLSLGPTRAGQYTMTFSRSAGEGTAFVVPCRKLVSTFEDFASEVDELACAEGLTRDSWRAWGAVGLLRRREEQSELYREIVRRWPQYFEAHVDRNCNVRIIHGPDERPALSHDGFLDIDWPVLPALENEMICDILLATVNEPTLKNGSYAVPHEIAKSYMENAKSPQDSTDGLRYLADFAARHDNWCVQTTSASRLATY